MTDEKTKDRVSPEETDEGGDDVEAHRDTVSRDSSSRDSSSRDSASRDSASRDSASRDVGRDSMT